MADDQWQSRSHGEIVKLLGALSSDAAHEEAQRWNNTSQAVSDSIDTAMATRQKLLDNTIWGGQAADAAYTRVDNFYKTAADPETGLAAEAGKISQAALQDGETLIAASRVAQNYPELGSGAPTERKKEELEAIRAEAQHMYTSPLSGATRPEITDDAGQQELGPLPSGNTNGGGGNTGAGSGGVGTQSPSGTDGLAIKDTKPQLAGGDSQQAGAGQGQGQGAGQGGGSGGGTPGGGTGSGGLGSGLGSGGKDSGTGLPVGSTTAAGFSPPSTGAGSGSGPTSGVAGGGLSGLRSGGLPSGATSGTGPGGGNPAAVSAAGVRGVGGPMGMMGGTGTHGRGGKGEDDDEHGPSELLINAANGQDWLDDPRKVVAGGVIGDFTAIEDAVKKEREAEKRRFKSIGWNVKFSDEEK